MIRIKNEILKKLNTDFDIKLNEQQVAAAFHVDGPAIVLAVPGAGKTTTMVVRIHNLINVSDINPENILTMTFSKASARDMQERYIKLFGLKEARELIFSTIHSFALSVIRNYERINSLKFQIIEGSGKSEVKITKTAILRSLYKEINAKFITEDELELLNNELGLVKNRKLDKNELDKHKFDTVNFIELYTRYEDYKKVNNLIDFDDMLTFAYEILLKNSQILKNYQQRYKYILVDEGQDTSLIQHELIKILVKPKNNIFLVADDDQSIYGFRGAEPKELKEFSKNYPGTHKYFIEKNYRSTQNIVSAANAFIKINYDRELKNMSTDNSSSRPIDLKVLSNEEEQLKYLYEILTDESLNGNTAILYRNNISAMLLIEELSRREITFSVRDNKLHFLKHWLILDVVAFITFSIDNSDIQVFEKLFYRMEAYLPKTALDKLKKIHKAGENVLKELKRSCGLSKEQILRVGELQAKFDILRTLKPTPAIEYISTGLNYSSYLKKYCRENNISEANTDELMFIIKRIASYTLTNIQFLTRMDELEQVVENSMYKGNKKVILSTIHGVKGLEFDNVIMVDLIEGKLPSRDSIKRYEEDKDISLLSEEARLFYVGITRAKHRLTLIATDYKNGKKVSPSRYFKRVYEIIHPNEKFIEKVDNPNKAKQGIAVGENIKHILYGEGKVVGIVDDKIRIQFANGEENTFPQSTIGKYLFSIE